ncbi:MAG: hypothetical protein ACE5KT_09260 [Methanosarcinales archaeon]
MEKPKEKRMLIIKLNTKSVSYPTIDKTTHDKKIIDIKDGYSGLSPVIDGLILEFSLINGGKTKKITTEIVRDYKELLKI